jgi:oligopeptidase B
VLDGLVSQDPDPGADVNLLLATPLLTLLALVAEPAPTGPGAEPSAAAARSDRPALPAPTPPVAPRRPHLSTRHGVQVDDPWFWLRDKEDPAVRAYLEAENRYTAAVTAPLQAFAEALYAEMLSRIQQTDLSAPVRRGAYWYFQRTVEGLQYPIRCRKRAGPDRAFDPAAAEELLLDQNQLAAGKPFLAIGDFEVSDDGRALAFTTDEAGFRQYRLFEKNLASGAVRGPLAERVTGVAWAADSATLFYVSEDPVTKRSDTLWRLPRGGAAVRVLEEKDPLFQLGLGLTRDHRYLVVQSTSVDTWESRLLRADQPAGRFRVVLPRQKGHKYDVDHRGGRLFIRTNRDAKNFRVVTAPVDDPSPAHWRPFVDHQPGVLIEGLELFKDHAVVALKQAALSRFRVHDFKRGTWRELTFPEPVYLATAGATPEFDTVQFRFSYQSLVIPPTIYDEDLLTGTRTLVKRLPVLGGYDPGRYQTERLWVTARDGVKVPVSLVSRKGLPRDGSAPLWLYGYGAYGLGETASFDSERISLLDRGVAFAIAHVRGGDELGEAWHDDGMLLKKQNTFGDFIDCAEALVKAGHTSRDRLLIQGGSAGGLLMGAVVNQRPDLFRAVHAAVPFVDVINTMLDASLPLTVVEYLEWGNPNEKAAFDAMRAYSPYDNLAPRAYPAMLVTTSFNDSQVMYWEPAKYVARLRSVKTDANPLLLKVKLEPAGHGGASGRYDALRDTAFEMAWMLSQVGITR